MDEFTSKQCAINMAINAQLLVNAHIEFITKAAGKTDPIELKQIAIEVFKSHNIPHDLLKD
ncbi:MAG TPA: hypothetical protein VL443_06280 [Cyclobacteriaceae bacterium]|jgi:hypothetical protein|nr:hypothetical protein [Cyclobacteriaceae bacterium]